MAISTSKESDEANEKKDFTSTVKSETKEAGDEVLQMTKKELFEMVQKMSKSEHLTKSKTDTLLEEMLSEMRDANEKSGNRIIGVRSIEEEDIDINDYLEVPATFFCYSFSHICMGDTRFGRSVKTPYSKPLRFKALYRYVKPGKNKYDNEIVSMSCCIVRSKKEAEWIRNHSLFGIKYFESTKGVVDINREQSDKLIEIMNALNSMSQFEIIERAKAEKIEITPDVDDVKKRLAYDLAEKSMRKSKRDLKKKTHHKISAVSQEFDVSNPDNIKDVRMDLTEAERVNA